jgi:ADP-ribose pyrophosphatase
VPTQTLFMPKPEIQAIASAVVYKNRWMTVREDAIVRSDGSQGVYGVVEKPDFAVIAAVREGHIYLVEQYRYPVDARFWELPQGSWEDANADALTLAKAELREETGLVAASMVHAGRLFLGYGYSTQAYNLFLASGLEQEEAQLEAEEQGLVAKAFEVRAVEEMIRNGTIKDATTVAAFGLLRLQGML